jgi:hypothetical protein
MEMTAFSPPPADDRGLTRSRNTNIRFGRAKTRLWRISGVSQINATVSFLTQTHCLGILGGIFVFGLFNSSKSLTYETLTDL